MVEIRNPVTYIRRWWDRVMGKEGIDFSFRIHPVTAIVSSAVIATIGFGAGRFVVPETLNIPFFEFGDTLSTTPQPTPVNEWKETAYTGKLQHSTSSNKYFLLTTSSEAISLDVDANIDLSKLVGRRIFAAGKYNKQLRTLKVVDVKDLEVLPNTPIPLPTIVPTSTPVVTSIPESTPSDSTTSGEQSVSVW